MASSPNGRPFYGTIWFSLVATAVVTAMICAAAVSLPSLEGRPTRGFGQFGVILVAGYWVFVFPRLRKIRGGDGKPEPVPGDRTDRTG